MHTKKKDSKKQHEAADALDWNEAMSLISRLEKDGRYRDAMLVASGCFLGLRISDLLTLRWSDLTGGKDFTLIEQKTEKKRTLRPNAELTRHARRCFRGLGVQDPDAYIFQNSRTDDSTHINRFRALRILKELKWRYGVLSARVFTTHSLRKTFGRRVWQQECDNNRGDQALLLLCDVFGHSNVAITKRYLGIRQEEILSVYDSLTN